MALEVRKTGGGEFYLVSVDKDGVKEVYQNGKLLKFKTSKEVKDALAERSGKDTIPGKNKGKEDYLNGSDLEETSLRR